MAAKNHPGKLQAEAAGSFYSPNSLQFFKKIKSRKLVIPLPKPFVREHGKSLCNHSSVRLEVPTGDVWEVRLENSDDGLVWFKNGWTAFTSFYKVKKGYYLCFRYKFGSNKFKVAILNKSAMEISRYPIRPPNSVSTPIVEEFEDDIASPVNKLSSNLSGFRSSKRSKISNNEEALPSKIGEAEAPVSDYYDDDDAFMSESDNSSCPSSQPLKRTRNFNGKASCSRLGKAQHRDMEGKHHKMEGKAGVYSQPDSVKYPFFELVIESYYLNHKNLWSFVKDNLKSWQKEQILTFKTKDGGSWPVKLRNYPKTYTARLGAGLADFLKDNSVEVGDLCTFELINSKLNLFMVSISKGGHEEMKSKEDMKMKKQIRTPIRPPSSSSTPIKELEDYEDDASPVINKSSSLSGPRSSNHEATPSKIGKAEALARTESFEVVMKPSSVHSPHTWWLPTKFVQEYIKDEESGEIKLIDISSNGKSKTWVVRYARSKEGRVRVVPGYWRVFVEENKLMVGDICVLKLMRSGDKIDNPLSFNITIRRDRASHEDQASTPHISAKAKMSKKVDKENKEGIIELDLEEEQEETSDEESSDEETSDSDEETSSDEGNQGVVADKQQQQQQPAGSKFVSKYPFFQETIKEFSFTRKILLVDREFAKDHINTELEEQTAIIQSGGGRSWPVKLICRREQGATFMYKLREFLEESSVKVGDVCIFELVDKKNMVFRVSVISRSDEAAN